MKAKNAALCFALLAGLIALNAGCPNPNPSASTIGLYVANFTSSPIDVVQAMNQQTHTLATVNTADVAPGTVQVFHLSKSLYSSPSTEIAFSSTAGGFSTDRHDVDFESDKLVGLVSTGATSVLFFEPAPVIGATGKIMSIPGTQPATAPPTPAS